MTFHPSTVEKLRKALEQHREGLTEATGRAERRRQELVRKQEELTEVEQKVSILTANIADCQRWLDFAAMYDSDAKMAEAFQLAALRRDAEMRDAREGVDPGAETADDAEAKYAAGMTTSLDSTPLIVAPAPDFKAGDLVNISDADHKRWGTRGSVVGYVYDPLGVVVEYDNLGNTVTVRPDQLMHHTEFVKQPNEYFDAAEAEDVRQIRREMAIEAGDFDPADEHDDGPTNADTLTAEEIDADGRDAEFALDAADAERWADAAAEDGGKF